MILNRLMMPQRGCSIFAVAGVFYVAALLLIPTIDAGQHDIMVSTALDAQGIRHKAGPVGIPPWIADAIRKRKPDYPYKERTQHHEGSGVFRLMIDLKTGSVTNIEVVQSTGFQGLDDSV